MKKRVFVETIVLQEYSIEEIEILTHYSVNRSNEEQSFLKFISDHMKRIVPSTFLISFTVTNSIIIGYISKNLR